MQPSGLGSAAVETDGVTVGTLAVVNPVGDLFTLEGSALTCGHPVPDPPSLAITARTNTALSSVGNGCSAGQGGIAQAVHTGPGCRSCMRAPIAYPI